MSDERYTEYDTNDAAELDEGHTWSEGGAIYFLW